MKLFIPFPSPDSIGGPSTFMRNLKNYLDENGVPHTASVRGSQGIFFPISYDLKKLKRLKKQGARIIQRLDGIYYPSKHGQKYLNLNKSIKKIYLEYADFVVFQSKYSKRQCFEMFGELPESKCDIIVNGVDTNLFQPGDSKPTDIFSLVTTGNFRNLDMLEPVVLALDALSSHQFQLDIIGPIVNNEIKNLLGRPYIKYLGPKSSTELASLLPGYHLFIYSHLNPPCPNSVLEAMACGLPVVGFDSGSMSELLPFSKDLLAPVSNEIFQRYEDFDPSKLAAKIKLGIKKYEHFKRLAMVNHDLHDFTKCGSSYVKIFEEQLNQFELRPWHKRIL